ncbi:DUF2958 domain-containing protein [Methylobacterium sp. J-030]|nr:DUF2958 domain-containing protein [Methylobacterium sp. J-030]MCJ2073376.1 DUF2958 domain-containing protein [Methylobacterium sp. J-030]
MMPALFTAAQRHRLLANGRRTAAVEDIDPRPVVKLFLLGGRATWLLTELDPGELTRAFGLCDLGLGAPELGYVDLNELARLRGCQRLPVERDRHFVAGQPLSAYASAARAAGRITA